MDKASLAALTATLAHYVRGEALREIPVWRMIALPLDAITARAEAWRSALGAAAAVEAGRSMIGGGSLPEESLPTAVVTVRTPAPDALARRLRVGEPAIVARVEHGRVVLDPRTVAPEHDDVLVARLLASIAAVDTSMK